jgi:hypothetical protein
VGVTSILEVARLAVNFALPGDVVTAERFGGGHINESWLIVAGDASHRARYLLQRINDHVFQRPALVMENIVRVTLHLAEVLEREGVPDAERRTLTLVPTRDGMWYCIDETHGHWRLFHFIERAFARESAANAREAYRAARAFGEFQRRLGYYRGPPLHETIPRFHHTPDRLAALEQAVEADTHHRCAAARPEIDLAMAHRSLSSLLLDHHSRGAISERIVHNDAKVSNVLFDASTGEALCVVDLDTVMPGLALYDFGDMARSMATFAAEDETDLTLVTVQLDMFEAIAHGYLDGAGDLLLSAERGLLVAAARVITYEQGVRFLTDFLSGDGYYRTDRPGHNLDRCRAQFALLEALTRAEPELVARLTGL